MKLLEETGEAAEVLNKRSGRKSSDDEDPQEQLGTDLADMIHYIVAIAAFNHIDLNDIMLQKDKAVSVKYHHDIEPETFLRNRTN